LLVVLVVAMLAAVSAAYADDLKFKTELSGAQEVPPVMTEGVGEARFASEIPPGPHATTL
jgi:hypothetical protein